MTVAGERETAATDDANVHGAARFRTVFAGLGALLALYFALPFLALGLGQSPAAVAAALADPVVVRAAVHTLLTASASTLVAAGLGVPLAYWLSETEWRGAPLVTALVVVPLVLPPIVAGMLLLSVFGQSGLQGLVGVTPSGTLVGIVLAQTFVAAPFVVLPTKSAFDAQDATLVEAAWSDGASEWRAFRRVTLPLAAPAILAGVTLAFARAAGEFGATLMVAYAPRTLPVQIWVGFQRGGLEAAFPVAIVLVAMALAALAVVRLLGGHLTVDVDH